MTSRLTYFHAPMTRSSGPLMLLTELELPFELRVLNLKAGEHLEPAFRAINPLAKVPALLDGDALVTEQVAIFLHLADLAPAAGLAPPIGDPRRGPYLRWMAFCGTSFEPAVVDRAMKREVGARAMSPYGSFDEMFAVLVAQLERGPYLLGETFTAADLLLGVGLGWTLRFGLIPEHPTVTAYAARIAARPSFKKVMADDAARGAEHAAATPAS